MLEYALIGCGRIAKNHITAAFAQKNLRIAAVCDIVPERMDAIVNQLPENMRRNVRKYANYQEMLTKESLNLCAVATESGKHAAIALNCIDAGANVIIEKPIALALADADEIIRRGKEKDVKVCACHQNRFNLAIQHIKNALEQGRFGKLSHGSVHVRWSRGEDYYKQAPWRGTREQDGGVLMNQSIHAIDLLCWMMGYEIEDIAGFTSNRFHPYIECEDIGVAVIRFGNGALGTIEGTANVFPRNLEETMYIFGETGTVKAGGKSMNSIDVWAFADERPEDEQIRGMIENTTDVYGNGHFALYNDFTDAVLCGRSPYLDGEDGRRALDVVLKIYGEA